LSKNLDSSSSHSDISVMRFKTYGLYLRSYLKHSNDDEDDGTWCRIEFPSFEDQQSHLIYLDIRLAILSFSPHQNIFIFLVFVPLKSIIPI